LHLGQDVTNDSIFELRIKHREVVGGPLSVVPLLLISRQEQISAR
jgi:hypothetical protein